MIQYHRIVITITAKTHLAKWKNRIKQHRLRTINIDSTNHKTKLCKFSRVLQTDKSPVATDRTGDHAKVTPAVYELLFSPSKYKQINFLEIGIKEVPLHFYGNNTSIMLNYLHLNMMKKKSIV
jgi:hypothetical protein